LATEDDEDRKDHHHQQTLHPLPPNRPGLGDVVGEIEGVARGFEGGRHRPELGDDAHCHQPLTTAAQHFPDRRLDRPAHLIRHAARRVPFHRDRLAALRDLRPGHLSLAAFRELPIMRREDIQNAGDGLIATQMPPGHGLVVPVRSSGSTGRPIEVRSTQLKQTFILAVAVRNHLWHKRDLGGKNVDIRRILDKRLTKRPLRWAPSLIATVGTRIR